MSFSTISLRHHLNSDEHDVLTDFYRPVLATARKYDRAVGYFSSSAFKACASELASFISKEGQIRLVVGCLVSQSDIDALQGIEVHEAEKRILREKLHRDLLQLSENDQAATGLLSKLILSGVATLKFAVRRDGIYHEKFGLFEDYDGGKIAFIGSANETEPALTLGGNHESISIYCSSEPSIYAAYGDSLEQRFEDLWQGRTRNTRIHDLDDESLAFVRELSSKSDLSRQGDAPLTLPKLETRVELRPYQQDAIAAWAKNQYRGILAMATGTGKTLTAIDAVKRFKGKVPGGAVVVTVPYQNLALQWIEALRDQGIEAIPVFGGFTNWYGQVKNLFLAANIADTVVMPCLVCVNDSFKDGRFQELLKLLGDAQQKHHLLIVDECHHFNSLDQMRKLSEIFSFRLGLSATPYNQFEKHHLDTYFGQVVYEFSLGRAIQEGFLTPYNYHLLTVTLDEEETEAYADLTRKIVQIAGSEDGFTPETLALAQPLLLKRARVVGAARDKLEKLAVQLRKSGRTSFNLFYCGDGSIEEDGERQRQIELVSQLLHKLGWRSSRITADESLKERELLLENLRRQTIDAVVSIKVLDEGIDIPVCRVAYLLASQSSDRQGIQRRGRVLRKSEGKTSAELFDFIVMGGATDSLSMKSLAKRELRRAWKFAQDAKNIAVMQSKLQALGSSVGITIEDLNDK